MTLPPVLTVAETCEVLRLSKHPVRILRPSQPLSPTPRGWRVLLQILRACEGRAEAAPAARNDGGRDHITKELPVERYHATRP